MYFWNSIKQRWQKVGCVAFSQNDNKRLILGSLKRRRQGELQNNSNRFRPRQHVFVFVWKTEKSVVYHLQLYVGKPTSSRFRQMGIVPESRLPFAQISSIYSKTAAKAWNCYQRWLERMKSWKFCNFVPKASKSCLSVGYWNETRISFWNVPSRKTGLPFQMFRCSRKFSAATTQNVVFHLLSSRIFRNFLLMINYLFLPVWPAPTVHTYLLKTSPKLAS